MALCPFAERRLLPENLSQPWISPTQIITHTAVDAPGPTSLAGYFGSSAVTVESHFWIRRDGRIEQYVDTNRRADANRWANPRAVSIETEDDGDPEGNPWTPAQITSLVRLIRWIAETHRIPLDVCPRWDAPGLGWHSLFGFDDPVGLRGVRDNPWSTSRGKTCPGRTRIRQFREVILPAIRGDDDDMTPELEARLNALDHKIGEVRDAVAPLDFRRPDGTPHNVAYPVLYTNGSLLPGLAHTVAEIASRQGIDVGELRDAISGAVSEAVGGVLRTAELGGVDVDEIERQVVEAVVARLAD